MALIEEAENEWLQKHASPPRSPPKLAQIVDKKLGRKAAVPILRNAQLEFTHASDQRPIARPGSPAVHRSARLWRPQVRPSFSPRASPALQRAPAPSVHRGSAQTIPSQRTMAGLLSTLVMAGSWQGMDGIVHHHPAMTARPLQNLRNLSSSTSSWHSTGRCRHATEPG
jgi:hypothetical protein